MSITLDQVTKRYLGLKVTETGSQNVNVCAIGFGGVFVENDQ